MSIATKMNNIIYLIFFFLVLCNLNVLIKGDNDPYSVPKAYSYGYSVSDDYSGSNYRVGIMFRSSFVNYYWNKRDGPIQ